MNSKEPISSAVVPLLRNPHIIGRVISAMFAKHVRAKREFRRGDGFSHMPVQQISFKITNACNLRCKTCGQWGETGYNLEKSRHELRKIVPLDRYIELVDSVKKQKPIYYIWGGEPFLYPGIMDLTARIKENKSVLSLVTNGTFLDKHAEEIVRQQWEVLMFSLDGPEAIHDEIRGKEGVFKKMANGINDVRRYKEKHNKKLPYLLALVTVSTLNAHKLDEIFDVAEELGVDGVVVYWSWFTDETIGCAHTRIFEEKLGVTPTSWKGYLFDHNVDTEALQGSLRRIREKKYSFPAMYIPNLKDSELAEYYQNPGNLFGYGPCISVWMTAEIMPNGDVAPCRDYPDYVTGNIMENTLDEIWNNDRYVKFRKTLHEEGGTFPICSRCCGLMGW